MISHHRMQRRMSLFVASVMTGMSIHAAGAQSRTQQTPPLDSIGARACEWDGWLPPVAARARFHAAHPLPETAERALRLALDSPDPKERDRAARALASGHDSATVTALLRHADDQNAIVRDGVLRSLGRIGSPLAESPLVTALGSHDPQIRQAAAWSLGQIEAVGASTALLAATRDTNEHVRSEAAWALGFAGTTSAMPRLRQLTTDEQKPVRLAAVCSIGWLRGDIGDAVNADPSEVVRAAAAWAKARSATRSIRTPR